jgi:hypothetical protein
MTSDVRKLVMHDVVANIDSAKQCRQHFADVPTIMLCASVPYELDRKNRDPHDWPELVKWNQRFIGRARPDRIRAAVAALTRVALGRKMRIVFGAHPSISPMMLQAARDLGAPARSILIFQSEAFLGHFNRSTLALADWRAGCLVTTAQQPEPPNSKRFPNSLERMRELMVAVPGIAGAVFIGGMNGVEREAEIAMQSKIKRYAIASTGSAAEALFNGNRGDFCGTLNAIDADFIRNSHAYTVVASKIVRDMLPSGRKI